MKIFNDTIDINLVNGVILILSCVFLFSIFEMYFDKKKNVWHINGPFPLPLLGNHEAMIVYKYIF